MYFLINFLLWNLGILWFGLFFSLGLEPRWEKAPRWALAVGFALFVLPVAYLKIKHPLSEALYWAAVVMLLLYVFLAFQDRLWRKILLFLLFIACTEIGELPILFLADFMNIPYDASFGSLQMTLLVTAETATTVIILSMLLIVWNRFITHRTFSRRIFIFLIFPVSQVLMLFAFDGSLSLTPSLTKDVFIIVGAFLGLISDFIHLYILMEQGQKEDLAKKLQEIETLHRLAEVHYRSIEARRHEMAKFRHDFNNQIAAAYRLTEMGESEQVRDLLDTLKSNLSETNEYTYCGNAIVNAVLNEKTAACEAAGIRLETELDLSEEPGIQPVHLCSIFSNLIDNAIRAAGAYSGQDRFISVKAARKEYYLTIKVENSSAEPKKENSDRKGYGQEILRDIVLHYDGEFMSDWKDGVYRAILSLGAAE